MAAIPLSITLPAIAGSLAYLNARTHFTEDISLLKSLIFATIATNRKFTAGIANAFYDLEANALSPILANHPFLVLAPDVDKDAHLTVEQARELPYREWTYRQFYDRVLQYAAWLKHYLGVAKGDIVAVDFTNKPELLFLQFALWSLGASPAFINTSLREEGLLHCVKISTAKVLVVDGELSEALTDSVRSGLGVRAVVLDKATEEKVVTGQGYRACDDCRKGLLPTDLCELIFTSGTTGLPKAATVNWQRWQRSTALFTRLCQFRPDDRFYSALPLYHSSGNMLGVGVALGANITFIMSRHFSPRTLFASVVATKATMLQYIGEMCRYLLNAPPTPFDRTHSLRGCFGNGMRPDVWRRFKERFAIGAIYEFYAATESPSASFNRSRNSFGEGAIGHGGTLAKLLRGAENILIKHDVDSGEPYRDPATGLCVLADLGEPGEMVGLLDAANVSEKYVGYHGNAAASRSKILRDVVKKGDMYFRTGDLLRSDALGRTFFVDRVGDTFRWKGENVSTGEVEKTVTQHPAVVEANVYGVQLPGHDGRAGCAAVVWDGEGASEAALRDLAEFVKRALPRFAAPLFLRSVPAMETTGTAKYQKMALRNAGVDPGKVGDKLYWLHPKTGVYQVFGPREWQAIAGGQTRL